MQLTSGKVPIFRLSRTAGISKNPALSIPYAWVGRAAQDTVYAQTLSDKGGFEHTYSIPVSSVDAGPRDSAGRNTSSQSRL